MKAHKAMATYLLHHQHFIITTLKADLALITDILSNPTILRHCPIAHLIPIPQDSSAIAYYDFSSHMGGRFLDSLRLWWHFQ